MSASAKRRVVDQSKESWVPLIRRDVPIDSRLARDSAVLWGFWLPGSVLWNPLVAWPLGGRLCRDAVLHLRIGADPDPRAPVRLRNSYNRAG